MNLNNVIIGINKKFNMSTLPNKRVLDTPERVEQAHLLAGPWQVVEHKSTRQKKKYAEKQKSRHYREDYDEYATIETTNGENNSS